MFLEEQLWNLILEDPKQEQPEAETKQNVTKATLRRRRRSFRARDSILRYSTGKPGSKRKNRFLNHLYLTSAQDDEDFQEPDLLFEEWTSPFRYFCEEKNKVIWEPFVEITEEEQKKLLEEIAPPKRVKRPNMASTVPHLDKEMRQFLLKHQDSEFLKEFEKELTHFFLEEVPLPPNTISSQYYSSSPFKNTGLEIIFKDSFCRYLGHALCRFYGFYSYSVDTQGQRITVVKKTKNQMVPQITLEEYLRSLSL